MTRALAQQLERLDRERRRLEELLARHTAWQGIAGLDRLRPAADAAEAAMRGRQRTELERMLDGNPVFEAHRSVVAAIGVIAELLDPPMEAQSADGDLPASAPQAEVADVTAEKVAEHAGELFDEDDGQPRQLELLSLSRSGRGGISTRAAMIHDVLPGQRAEGSARTPTDHDPDDLTRIRRINRALARDLVARGVRHFSDIAAFGPADVRSLAAALGLGRRINQENWIEQAALLVMRAKAKAGQQDSSSEGARRDLPDAASPVAGKSDSPPLVTIVANQIAAAIVPAPALPPLMEIAETQGEPMEAGGDALGTGAILQGDANRVASVVRDAALRIAGGAVLLSPSAVAESDRVDEADLRADELVEAEGSAGEVAAVDHVDSPAAGAILQEPPPDDMTLIYGIDHGIADQLRSLGVTRYHHLAEIDAAGVAGIRNELGVRAQISRHGWIEQAVLLDRGHGTAHSWRMIQGDYDALVDYPAQPPRRDPDFAQWLLEHASSHAPAAVPELAEEFAVSSDDVAQAAAQREGGDLVSYSTGAAAVDMHVVAVEPDAGARVVFDEDADQSKSSPYLVPEAGLVQQAELVGAPLHEEGAEPSGAGVEGHARSIVDRITAIERDAAELPLLPSRLFAAAPPPSRVSSPPPDAVPLQQATSAAGEMAAVPLSRSDEADVRIYMREMQAAGLEPMREQRRENPSASGRDFDKDDYAAYRDRVEEAAVEIITALPDDQAQVSGDQEAGDAGFDRPKVAGQVRRFLKALKGE